MLKALKSRSNIREENRLKFIRDAHNKKEGKVEQLHTDRMEDYLEVIYELIQHKGYATSVDISESQCKSS